LEHWYEQLTRHLGLPYVTSDPACADLRGIVYLDGLGDIVDVQAPLPKLQLTNEIDLPASDLAHYSIVLTTFERCAREWQLCNSTGRASQLMGIR
jgi:hypothetical protein